MKVAYLVHHFQTLALLVLVSVIFTVAFHDYDIEDLHKRYRVCKFDRIAEAKRECSSFLSSASKLEPNKMARHGIGAGSLSFQNGDWKQEAGGAPLMPFDDSDIPNNFSRPDSLLKLVSFWLTSIDYNPKLENYISVCGYISIGIKRSSTLTDHPENFHPRFHSRPGTSLLNFPLEGLYMETEENEGERVLCMMGSSVSPFEEQMRYVYVCNQNHSLPEENDRIMLLLRYPRNFTLTRRAIIGELWSLNVKTDPKYFDNVHISSQYYYEPGYQYASENFVEKASHPFPEELIDNGIQLFKGPRFCELLRQFGAEMFDIVSDSSCDDTNEHCSNLGPFELGSDSKASKGMLNNFRLVMTDVRCAHKTAKVAAVFRALSSLEDRYAASARTGLSGMTISAEGTWNSSSGQLCMVGCVGVAEIGSDQCKNQVCLFFPVTFSIIQRSIVIGTISSIGQKKSYSTLLFKKVLSPLDLLSRYHDYSNSHLSYKFSKTELAKALLNKLEMLNLGTFVKQTFLQYPYVEDTDNKTSLSQLSQKLSFHVHALPYPFSNAQASKTYVNFQVLSLGGLFGRYWPHRDESCPKQETRTHTARQELLLNVSAELNLDEKYYSHVSVLFLEGLYNVRSGTMYLIGCRDVLDFQQLSNVNLESGMDCSIEVKVEFTSENIRWLINPTAKVSIASQRNVQDPLHFRPICLETSLITYRDNLEEITFRANVEGLIRILVLVCSVFCILSQLSYIAKMADVDSFMSLSMLAVQALGYGLPLITGGPILFKWKEFHYPRYGKYTTSQRKTIWFQGLDCIVKLLSLVAFVLTAGLCQKVWKSRNAKKPASLRRIPSEKVVFLCTLLIYVVGFTIIHAIRNKKPEKTNQLPQWPSEVSEYMGVVQDLFLLPQILGNAMWHLQGTRPTRKVYYIGFTYLRFLVRVYDYMRDPVFNPSFHGQTNNNPSSELFSKTEDIVAMSTLAFLATIVHIQQKWSYNL